MESWNQNLFLLVNASQFAPSTVVAVARIIALWSVPLTVVLAAALWIWGRPSRRGAILIGGAAVLLGLTLNFIVSLTWFHPRPFMIGLGQQLLPHAAETSFPSDHVTLILSFGFGLLLTRQLRRVAPGIVMLGFLTAWARVYLGVHFPIDMLGSLVVAVVGALGAIAIRPLTETNALPRLEALYERTLILLRLPASIFLRMENSKAPPGTEEAKQSLRHGN